LSSLASSLISKYKLRDNNRNLTDGCNEKALNRRRIGEVSRWRRVADKVYVSEEKKITVDTLNVDEGSKSLCRHIADRRRKLIDKQCIGGHRRNRFGERLCSIGSGVQNSSRCINEYDGKFVGVSTEFDATSLVLLELRGECKSRNLPSEAS